MYFKYSEIFEKSNQSNSIADKNKIHRRSALLKQQECWLLLIHISTPAEASSSSYNTEQDDESYSQPKST
jgi:hypothetical protein